ncbi:MAG TPA: amino acid adenylation domain-containing protein [Streptosporangiaceae bacterium]
MTDSSAVSSSAVSPSTVSESAVSPSTVSESAVSSSTVSPAAGQLSAAKQALLAERLRRRAGTARRATIPVRPEGAAPPLSYAQERLWFLEQFAPGTTRLTIPLALRLTGPLDIEALRQALDAVVARHEALRMRFPATDDGRPLVVVADQATLPLEVVDAVDEEAAHAAVDAFMAVPFDLAQGPVARALLVRLADTDHVLAIALHHIAGDGWSADVLTRDIFAGYAGQHGPEPPVGYGDYAAWQRATPPPVRELEHWRRRLAGLEPLDLPTDRPRPPEQTYDGAAHSFALDPEVTQRLLALGRDRGATPYMVLLAGFAALLGRYGGADDVAIGSPVAGRSAPELTDVVGCFVNMLTMRADLSGDPSFAELLARIRDVAVDAYDHQELPFEQLVAELDLPRDVSRSPLFGVILAMQNYGSGAPNPPPGLTAEGFALGSWVTRYDLELYAVEDADSGLSGLIIYNTDLFEPDTIGRLAAHLDALLREVAAHPDRPLAELDLLTERERRLVLDDWNDTAAALQDAAATLHGLIETQAARTPDAVAVRFEGTSQSYAELNAAANRVAHVLRAHGVGSGTLVAVCAERSPELMAGLLGVLKAGGAYLPLDPDYPPDRLAFMLTDAFADDPAPVLLTQRALEPALPATTATVLRLDDSPTWAEAPVTDPPPVAGPSDIAYVIYTSGSTGRPKGVPNTHRGIGNRLDWMQRRFALTAGDVVVQKTPISFDVSVWELFWPLRCGARLVLATPGGHKDAGYLRELIDSEGVTTAHFVPSMLNVFLTDFPEGACGALRRVVCSGEELPVDLARRCVAALSAAELHNLYGPTEAAVDVSAWHCRPDALADLARVPIGAPIANTTLYVLDAALRPVPVGIPGELFIGGTGLARGYLNRPALTAERFVPDPYGPPGARLYRTGDLARWRPDGTVEFLGRLDNQIKLRGLRIELGEIEAALRGLPGVRDAAVIVREDRPGDKRLVGYLAGGAPDHVAVRAELKRSLPDYMVPAAFVDLDALPLNPNGKLDRAALPAPVISRDAATAYAAPGTPTERLLAGIWAELLGPADDAETIGLDDDFFDLGGHSLLATQVVAKLRREVGDGVSVMDLFKHRTIRELAALADTPAERRGPRALLHELTPRRTPGSAGAPALSYVCVPFGGGSAVVYQPLADALPGTYALWSVAIPGHDVGLDEDALPFDELAARCVREIQEKVSGPVALYGHCGVGSALIVEIARRLEAAGRELTAVYIGAIFPFARPGGTVLSRLARFAAAERLRGNQPYVNWLISMGVDMSDLDPAQARQIIQNMRRDSEAAEDYYTGLLVSGSDRLRAPVITIAGTEDPATDYFQERFREWHFLTSTSAVVVLDEAGHFFLKYRADELAEIVTGVHEAVASEARLTREDRGPDATWWLHGVSRSPTRVVPTGPQPSLRRFLAIAASQLVSVTGSALTEFAVPLWIYITTGSVVRFALLAVVGLVPGLLTAPIAGAIVDRTSRRRVMLYGDIAAGTIQLTFGLLLWTGHLQLGTIYPLLGCLSVALTFQRLAYASAVPQLVPKQYLGHANGVVQLGWGTAQLLVPLVAVGLLAAIGLGGILALDVASYTVAVAVVMLVRFPATMAWRRRESVMAETLGGLRYSLGHRGFVGMLLFFVVLNVFLSPLFLMFSPLVLSFAELGDVGRISFLAGLGTFVGALIMIAWGGPRHRRMHGVLLASLALGCCCLITGVRADLPVIAVGVFGMALWLTLLNGIYATIVQVKVPQRLHGRVFAMNTLIAWSTLPIGFGLIAPYGVTLLDPLLAHGGPLAGNVGALIGTGPGRGIGLMYVLFALAIVTITVVAMRTPTLARFDDEIPDATPDDLIGVERLRRRTPAATTEEKR